MCGLKFDDDRTVDRLHGSHPMWDVWIEISCDYPIETRRGNHIPCGMCGLKYFRPYQYTLSVQSHPMWDVWIKTEMTSILVVDL